MRHLEGFAIALAVAIVLGLPAAVLGYQYGLRPALSPVRVIDVIAYAPEAGGFQPANIRVAAGETVTVRFHAADVVHGVAIGPGLGINLGDIDPGQVREMTLAFDEPGTFTFYCTTWCSKDHWRMRGLIEVVDPADPARLPPAERDPVIDALAAEGIDIDSFPAGASAHGGDHAADQPYSTDLQPDAGRGVALADELSVPEMLASLEWRRAHTPLEALELLARDNDGYTEAQLADAVASLWVSQPLEETVAAYNANCAACHGQTGAGDGPAAGQTAEQPTAFGSDTMLPMRADVLYAKIRRGGMGTDMPNFGTLFTPEETWALVDYLWWLALAGAT